MIKNVVHKLPLNLYEKAQNNDDDEWTCIFEHIFLKGVIIHIRFIHFTGGKGLKKQVTIHKRICSLITLSSPPLLSLSEFYFYFFPFPHPLFIRSLSSAVSSNQATVCAWMCVSVRLLVCVFKWS